MPNVAFDARFDNEAGAIATPFTVQSNGAIRDPGVVGANSNRALFGFWGFKGLADPASVTMSWNGVGMTFIVKVSLGSPLLIAYLFGLTNPDTGDQILRVDWTGGGSITGGTLGAVSLFNVDSTTPWSDSGTSSGTSTSASSDVTTTSGDMAIAGHCNNNSVGLTLSTGTSAWINTFSTDGNFGQAYNAAVGASTNITWAPGSSVEWGNVFARVRQVSAGGPSTEQMMAVVNDHTKAAGFVGRVWR